MKYVTLINVVICNNRLINAKFIIARNNHEQGAVPQLMFDPTNYSTQSSHMWAYSNFNFMSFFYIWLI